MVRWTKEMDNFVMRYYTKVGPVTAAKRLDVPTEEVSKRALFLGATKRADSKALGEFDAYDSKYKHMKESINVGDHLKFPVEKVINGKIIKSMHKKKVVEVHSNYVVLDNGRYRESFMFKDLVNLLKIS